ncbi:MAG: DUF1320 domain-containing protein [Bacteroidetes bacterium]|nr:DUF1320 domain-containing protein [Bacteroidota bacterium]
MYSTYADIAVKRISLADLQQLLCDDPANPFTDVQLQAAVEALIPDADSMIDSYATRWYVVPMDPIPAIVKKSSADMVCHSIYQRRPFLFEGAAKTWADAYTAAMSWLKDIAAGKAIIEGASRKLPATTPNSGGVVISTDPTFTKDSLKGL